MSTVTTGQERRQALATGTGRRQPRIFLTGRDLAGTAVGALTKVPPNFVNSGQEAVNELDASRPAED